MGVKVGIEIVWMIGIAVDIDLWLRVLTRPFNDGFTVEETFFLRFNNGSPMVYRTSE